MEENKKNQKIGDIFREGECLVHVSYNMTRDKGALESEFSINCVSELFYGNFDWQIHQSCAEMDQVPGNRAMLPMSFVHRVTDEEVISMMDKLGYRPATHLEAYAFQKAFPDDQRQSWIVALGSFVMHGDPRGVMVLAADSNRRTLLCRWLGCEWPNDCRFLAVRK